MTRALFVTNLIPHYRLPLFQRIARLADTEFIVFSDGAEWYWQSPDAGLADLPGRRLRGWWIGRTRITPGLPAVVLRARYDVLIAGMIGKFALPVNYLGARIRRRGFVLWTGLWQHPASSSPALMRWLSRYLYRHADAVVTYGRHVSRFVVAEGAPPHRVVEAPQAVDLTLFTPTGRAGSSSVRIGFVGRLEPWKGPLLLLAALAQLKRRAVPFEASIIGTGTLTAACLAAIASNDLQKDVELVGHVSNADLPARYRNMDVLVVPSVPTEAFLEPWSLAVNEAMGCGVVVVASDAVGAVADGLVAHEESGIVFRQGDVQALAEVLSDLVAAPQRLDSLRRAAELAIQQYSFDKAAEAFLRAMDIADEATRSRRR